MRAFSQLLDDLVYTRSRNTKLKLIGDYLKETPDPDRGYGLAALTGTLDIPHVKPAAVRGDRRGADRPGAVLHEPRLCRRHGRDGGAAVAEARRRAAGNRRRDDRHFRRGRAAARRVEAGCAARPRGDARPSRRVGPVCACSSWRPAGFGSGSARGSRSRRWPKRSGSRSKRSRRCGTGSSRRSPNCSTGPRAEASSRPCATCRCSARSCSPTRSTRRKVSLDDYAAEWKWDGIRVQLVHAGGETRLYSRTGDDISGSFPDVAEAFRTQGVLDGELLVRGSEPGRGGRPRRRCGQLQRAAAAARPQERQPEDARAKLRRSCGSTISCSTATRICASSAGSERRARLEPFVPTARPGAVRHLAIDRGRELRGARGPPRQRPRRRDRGDHAQAPRQPLCRRPPHRPVVQMEARSADRRLRADVRPARIGQTLELLQRLHLRLLDR